MFKEATVAGEEIIELAVLEKDCERIEHFGLTMTESKEILKALQQHVLERQTAVFIEARQHCLACGRRLGLKGRHTIMFRTLFGDVALDSPRLGPGLGFISFPAKYGGSGRQEMLI